MKPIVPGVLVFLLALPAGAGAELILDDGTILSGTAVERKEDTYLLKMEDGEVIPVPVEFVKKLRLTGEDDPAPSGIVPAEPTNLADDDEPKRPPSTYDQLEAFGRPPASFPKGIEFRWVPKSGLGPDVTNFNPAKWYRPAHDPIWKPTSAYKASQDVTHFNPARWYRSPIDPTWKPKDGFNRPPQFFPLEVPPSE